MATDIYADARKRTKNVKTTPACEFCNNPRCNGDHSRSSKKTKDGQLLQQIKDNPNLDWRQKLGHPDQFTSDGFDDRLGQVHQLFRDNPTIRGAVKSERAHTIGWQVRLAYTPDYSHLGLDIGWQMEAAALIEDMWERDMEDPVNCWNDASQCQTMSGQFGTGFMSASHSGEILGVMYPEDKPDNRPWSMSVGLIDIARLSTPLEYAQDDGVRQGKRLGAKGQTKTYYIASELPGVSCYNRFSSMARRRKELTWTPVRPFTSWGSPQLFHWFDKDRPDQSRGVSDLASSLKRSHMLETYEETIIDSAIRDAAFSLWVQSNSPNVGQAFSTNPGLSPGDFVEEVLGATMKSREDYYASRDLELEAGRGLIAQLMTDEELKSLSLGSPNDNHVNFGRSMQTAIARSLGIDPYSLHGDMTNVNFSTIRAAWIQSWQNRYYKRDQIFNYMGQPIFQVWLEDKIARGEFVIPGIRTTRRRQLNYFYQNRRALTMVEFCGPGMESIDPIKGFKAQQGAILCGLQTRDQYFKQFTNTTFRKATARLKYEQEYLRELGLDEFTVRGSVKGGSDIGGGLSDRVDSNT